ncbi:MAG: putative aminohydrolase SsnA [Chloroflexi bacterium]|nr:putative aminohydrolase SsnA [Chloroflexota bacterium]
MTGTLITNATLVTWGSDSRLLPNHALLINEGRIEAMGPSANLAQMFRGGKYHGEPIEFLDAHGQLVMPGNICAHTHFYGAFARGMAIPGDAPKDFPEILEKLWWRLDRALTLDDVRYSALVCLVDAVKHGTTTLIDHHASPNAIDGSLDVIAEAVSQTGLRACLCYEVTDRNGPEGMRAGIAENVRFIKSQTPNSKSQIAATFGLHASLTLSDETLEACRAAHDGGFHIHVAEHEADEYDSLKRSGTRAVDRLNKFGILGPRSIAAHCVHIDYREAELLRETGARVTHQPRSNMNNAVGAADVDGLLRLGVPVCLGNDGFSNAMWEEWKAAYLLHKVASRDPRRAGGYNIAQMALANNAALANMFFPAHKLGVLEPGATADLMFVDYHPITPLTAGNIPWHIIFGFESSMVTTTICGGKVLMKDRQLLFLDEAEITAKSRELAAKVWERYNEL